jgi:hypothetical protein
LKWDTTVLNIDLDLMPFKHFLGLYRHSPILTLYIYAYWVRTFIASQLPNIDLSEANGVPSTDISTLSTCH